MSTIGWGFAKVAFAIGIVACSLLMLLTTSIDFDDARISGIASALYFLGAFADLVLVVHALIFRRVTRLPMLGVLVILAAMAAVTPFFGKFMLGDHLFVAVIAAIASPPILAAVAAPTYYWFTILLTSLPHILNALLLSASSGWAHLANS